MELPKNEATFEIKLTGDTTLKEYEGLFTVRCVLTMGQKHAMELEKSRLLGSYTNPTDYLQGIADVFANLRAKVIEAPEWYKQSQGGTTIKDENVLVDIYNKIKDAEDAWKENVKKLANPSTESQSQSQ